MMQRRDFLAAGSAGVAAACAGARRAHPMVVPGPSPASSRPRPSRDQLAWHRRELALFLHFGINTFTDREWGLGNEDPALFAPASLDARQWARAARAGGFRTVILTAKHHDGFCLWPSALTRHSVASSPWQGGRGDVVRDLAVAARAEGLSLGLYLSPWDRHEPTYGDTDRYNTFYCAQLTELLTRYGAIAEVWFDGANGEGPNGRRQEYDWPRIHAVVRRLQPRALIFSDAGPDLRWAGNELGVAGDPNWCTVDPATVPVPGMSGDAVTRSLLHGEPDGTVWRPAESDVSIRPGWFWHPAEDSRVRTAGNLLELYLSSVGRNSGLLLNVPPTRDGLLHATDVSRLAEFAALHREIFGKDAARAARATAGSSAAGFDPARVLDADPDTFWMPPAEARSGWIELDLARPAHFDLVSLEEAIAYGQTIESFTVDGWQSGWVRLADGTTIGHRRIIHVASGGTTRVRIALTSRGGPPRLSRIGLHSLPA
jgi:alpha-L-fucosidase